MNKIVKITKIVVTIVKLLKIVKIIWFRKKNTKIFMFAIKFYNKWKIYEKNCKNYLSIMIWRYIHKLVQIIKFRKKIQKYLCLL